MSPSFRQTGRAAAAAALLIAGAAWAAEGPAVSSLWDIQPSEAWTAPRELAKGEVLVEPAILPKALIEIMEDVPGGAGGDYLLRRGDLLYRLTTAAGAVYCTIEGQQMIGSEARFAHTILVCLVDADSDGTFEGHYRKNATRGVPVIFGSVPATLRPLGPVRHESRPPSTVAGRYSMRVELDSDPAKGKPLRFTYTSAAGGNTLLLTASARVPNGPYPQSFEVLGGYFQLIGVNGGKAVIRMISPTTPYPFLLEPESIKY
jgi:hypothetical protein